MPIMKMETVPNQGLSGTNAGLAEAVAQTAQVQKASVRGLGTVDDVRAEIDDALADMRSFHRVEPDEVMRAVSAHSARLIELIVHIQRVEVVRREWKSVREECDRVLAEMKQQFQIASRLLAMRQQDWEMSSRGQV